jgi:hypothetical protein
MVWEMYCDTARWWGDLGEVMGCTVPEMLRLAAQAARIAKLERAS